jgi:hypothetical protein
MDVAFCTDGPIINSRLVKCYAGRTKRNPGGAARRPVFSGSMFACRRRNAIAFGCVWFRLFVRFGVGSDRQMIGLAEPTSHVDRPAPLAAKRQRVRRGLLEFSFTNWATHWETSKVGGQTGNGIKTAVATRSIPANCRSTDASMGSTWDNSRTGWKRSTGQLPRSLRIANAPVDRPLE